MAAEVNRQLEAPPQDVQAAHDRLALYFRSLGLSATAAEAAIREVEARLEVSAPDASELQRARAAIPEAISLVAEWIEPLSAPPESETSAHGQLLWRLRAVLRRQSEAMAGADDPSEAVRQIVRQSCRPILPPEARLPMPTEPLGRVPPLLRRAFWRRVGKRLMNGSRKAVRVLTTR